MEKIIKMRETIKFLQKFCKALMLTVLILMIALTIVSIKLYKETRPKKETVQIASIVLKEEPKSLTPKKEIQEQIKKHNKKKPIYTIITNKKFNDAAKLPPLPKIK